MPSEKLTRILLSKSPFSEEQISQMSETEGWHWVYANAKQAKEKRLEVCFTGFSDAEKGSLSQLAIDAGFSVVTTVTRHLEILCTGLNPGPSKLEKAKKQQVNILNVEQFKRFMATGEISTQG